MRATHWLIGCTLCMVGIGSAAATSLDTQELDTSHTTVDGNSSHEDANASCGDTLLPARDCSTHSASRDNPGTTSDNNTDRSGGGSVTTPARTRQTLGWQSLLPGSIQ